VPKSDEILVQVHAVGLNPIDYMIPKGTFKPFLKFELPATLGSDLAGVVVEVGNRVTRFKPGSFASPRSAASRTRSCSYCSMSVRNWHGSKRRIGSGHSSDIWMQTANYSTVSFVVEFTESSAGRMRWWVSAWGSASDRVRGLFS
jgi:D-arabinose 1-dehydrogenase-like Zn-dependent alcohol dehydrogenase